jgi:hypothetical protein
VLRFFNSNSIGVLVLLALIPILYWIPDFFKEVPLHDQAFTGTVPALWIASFNAHYRVLSMLIALLIILANAFLLIQLNTIHIFIPVRTQLPALFYIVLTAGFNPAHQLTPALVVSLLVIIVLFRLFVTYKSDGPSVNFLDTGFLIAIASMIYFPAILLFVFLIVALVMLRPLDWREWVYIFLGLMLPYLFVVSGYYVAGVPVREFFPGFGEMFQHHRQTYSIMQLTGWLFLVGMVVYSSYFMASAIDNMKIHGRKIFMLFLWLFLFSVCIYLVIPGVGMDMVSIAAIPLSYLFSHYFCNCTRNWINEGILSIFLVMLVLLLVL